MTHASKTETVLFDAARYLTSTDAQSELLSDALETGDPSYIASALGTIARARGMSEVAQEAGITREGLYKALSGHGDPRLSTVMGVMKALGLEFRAVPATQTDRTGDPPSA